MSPSERTISNSSAKTNTIMTINTLTIFLFQNIIPDFLIDKCSPVAGMMLPILKHARLGRKVGAVNVFRSFLLQKSQNVYRNLPDIGVLSPRIYGDN